MYKNNNNTFNVAHYFSEMKGSTLYSKLKTYLQYKSNSEGNKMLTQLKKEGILDLIKIEKLLIDKS